MKLILQTFATLQHHNPLTGRGILVVGFALALLLGPARQSYDLVAAVLGTLLTTLVLTALIISGVTTLWIRRRLMIDVATPALPPGELLLAHHSYRFDLVIGKLPLPPFFPLTLELIFPSPLNRTSKHILNGPRHLPTHCIERVTFPHRGIWSAQQLSAAVTDQLGLVCFRWRHSVPTTLQGLPVAPPLPGLPRHLPLENSLTRDGDIILGESNRKGDPFDLKRYEPADGISKIVWKIFAKSDQLVARHPEPAYTPEGRVHVFCLAGRFEDYTAGAAIELLKGLETSNIEFLFGCNGMGAGEVKQTSLTARELLITTAWNADDETRIKKALSEFAGHCHQQPHQLAQGVLLICSSSRLKTSSSLKLVQNAAQVLESQGLRPNFVVIHTPELTTGRPKETEPRDKTLTAFKEWLRHKQFKALLVDTDYSMAVAQTSSLSETETL